MPGMDLEPPAQTPLDAIRFRRGRCLRGYRADAYNLFFQPPRYPRDWDILTDAYRLLLALSQDEDDRGIATVLAAAAAMNAGRDDHATALALEAQTTLESLNDQDVATTIPKMLSGCRDYPNMARNRIWQMSRQVGLFGPYHPQPRKKATTPGFVWNFPARSKHLTASITAIS